jgi:hypothetical protein
LSCPAGSPCRAGFTYAFNCGDGAGFSAFSTSSSQSCSTTETGARTVRGKIRDEDGGVTKYTAVVSVVTTAESLCDLTHEFSSKEDIANALCGKLEDGAIRAYRNQVTAQSGKAFTANEAEILRALALDL